MKTRECVKDPEASPMYRLGRRWNTIQAYLIPGIEDDIGTSPLQRPSRSLLSPSLERDCAELSANGFQNGICLRFRLYLPCFLPVKPRCAPSGTSPNQNLHALHVLHGYQKRFCNYLSIIDHLEAIADNVRT